MIRERGMKLVGKFLTVTLIPLICIVVVALIQLWFVSSQVSEKLTKKLLMTTNDEVVYILGNSDLTETQMAKDTLRELRDRTGAEFVLFMGSIPMVSSFDEAIQAELVIPDAIMKELESTGSYFATNESIAGNEYYGYYKNIETEYEGIKLYAYSCIDCQSVSGLYTTHIIGTALGMLGLAVVAAFLIGFTTHKITKAIEIAVGNLDKVADGDLEFQMAEKMTHRSDEVGNVARAVRTLIQKFSYNIADIHTSTESLTRFSGKFKENFNIITDYIENVNMAVEEIANGATNQATEAMRVSNCMADMGNAIEATNHDVNELLQSTTAMKVQNQKMYDTLEELSQISVNTSESIHVVHAQTNDTNRSVEEIRDVVDLISNIAAQTNLLSLNASIEAARAGEQGRGFAVVADEVRNLAEQSRTSAKQISDIVEGLIQKSNVSVVTMESVQQEIEQQNEKICVTQEVFDSLNREIEMVAELILNIARQSELLNESKCAVIKAMEGLTGIAEANAANSEETVASMIELGAVIGDCDAATNQLLELSEVMKQNVRMFKLGQ